MLINTSWSLQSEESSSRLPIPSSVRSAAISLMMAKNGDFLSLPVRQSFGEPQRVIRFQDIYQATNLKVQAALDEFIAEHKKWLRIG